MNWPAELESPLRAQADCLRPLTLVPLWVRGEDRVDFLNRLLTQEVPEPGPDPRFSWAALCQAQGRVIALFRIASHPDAVILLMENDLASRVRDALQRYILRSRVHLELGDPGRVVGGWRMPESEENLPSLPPDYSLLGLDPHASALPRYLACGPPVKPPSHTVPDSLWRGIDFWIGIPRILAATSGQFVPHALHLTGIGAVSLRKGCYPGQEVIARTEYRGRIKRLLVLLETPTVHPPGTPLTVCGSGDPLGTVLDSLSWPETGTWTQAVVSEEGLARILSESGTRVLRAFRPA